MPQISLLRDQIAELKIFSKNISFNSFIAVHGEGNGTPLQNSCLENPMDGGAWWAAVHGVAKSRTWLSDFTFTFYFYALEKEMATHSSVLAWTVPGMELHRAGHDWSDLLSSSSIQFMLNGIVLTDSVKFQLIGFHSIFVAVVQGIF